MATQQKPSSGNVLTQRVGPFPVWLWGVIAIGVYFVFFRKKTATTTASTGVVTSGTPQTESITYPTGASYTGPVGYAPTSVGGGGGGSGGPAPPPSPTPGTSTTTPTPGAPAAGTVLSGGALTQGGAGYSLGNYQPGAEAGGTGSVYSTLKSYTETVRMLQSGQPVYYQPAPGQFSQITSMTQLNSIEPNRAKAGKGNTTTYTLAQKPS